MMALFLALLQSPNVMLESRPPAAEPLVSAVRRIQLAGRPFRYTMTAGRLPILDNETGEAKAWVFFVAYTAGGRARRPVTFAWNGGPGSNAGLIQLGGIGPRRHQSADVLIDNQETWLDRTDLVFVDPVGTGYSRVTRADYGADFYQTRGDAEAMAEFVRVYRNRFGRWGDPVYLAGESFGVTRAGRVAEVMARRRMPLAGVVLIGLAAPLAPVPAPVREALAITSFAAAAWHHRRLDSSVRKDFAGTVAAATRFALDTLAPALAGHPDAAGRHRLARARARYLGVLPGTGDTTDTGLSYYQYARLLLADQGLRLGHYDTRRTAAMDPPDQPYDPNADPSLTTPLPPDAVPRYLRTELRYHNDLQYSGPFGGSYPPATKFRGDWMSVRWRWEPGENSDTTSVADPPLRQAMTSNPALRVVAVCGWFDLICSPATNDWVRSQLPADLQTRIVTVGLAGGHAVYLDAEARVALKALVVRLISPR